MPRRARITAPGIPVHVVQRGNNRNACFVEDADRAFYLFQLGRLLPQEGCRLHAYCLMGNHLHLLLTSDVAPASGRMMRRLALLHTQYMNKRYGRTGTLWEGRYKSCLVQSAHYLLMCQRYIELNPVRAGLVFDPASYRWSSYAANALGTHDPLLAPHSEYLALSAAPEERLECYRSLFGTLGESFDAVRKATNGNYVLGDEAFKRRMARLLGRRVQPGVAGRPVAHPKVGDGQDLFEDTENVVRP